MIVYIIHSVDKMCSLLQSLLLLLLFLFSIFSFRPSMPLAKQPKVSKQTVCKIAFKLHINTEYMRSAPQYAIISNFFFSQIPLNFSVLLHFGSSLKCRSTYDLNYYPFFFVRSALHLSFLFSHTNTIQICTVYIHTRKLSTSEC